MPSKPKRDELAIQRKMLEAWKGNAGKRKRERVDAAITRHWTTSGPFWPD
jgi:hypothetical protein